jgi:diguanylate cyclase (GGDEF)-like protein
VQRAVLYIDVDRFKAVNDHLGHRAGDEVLIHVARQLAGRIRPTDTAVRLGGDEFLVVLDGLIHVEEALRVARRLLRALCGPYTLFRTQRVDLAVSVGVALWGGATTLQEAIDDADALMYAAKELGGAAIAAAGPDGRRLIGTEETDGRDLDAVLAGAVHVRVAPIVHRDGRPHGLRAEVDVELRHPSVDELAGLVIEAVGERVEAEGTVPGALVLVPGASLWATDGLVLRLVVALAAALPGVPIRIVLRDGSDQGRSVDQALLIRDALGIGLVVGGLGASLGELGLVDRVDPIGIELSQTGPVAGAASITARPSDPASPSSIQVAAMAVAARGGLSVYAPAAATAAVAAAGAAVDGSAGVELLVIDAASTTEHRREGPRRSIGGERAVTDASMRGTEP